MVMRNPDEAVAVRKNVNGPIYNQKGIVSIGAASIIAERASKGTKSMMLGACTGYRKLQANGL